MIHQTGYWNTSIAESHHIHSNSLSNWIVNFLNNHKKETVIDFGCGLGMYLNDLHKNGFESLIGVEVVPPNREYPFEIKSFNLTEKFDLNQKGNVISLEVGEHIPVEYMDVYLDNITSHCSNYLIVSWALRNQGGYGHVNELNNDEIIPHILKRGFVFLENETIESRKDIEDFCIYFKNSLLIFKRH